MKLAERIHRFFRVCMHCGSFESGPSQFCRSCEADLWRFHNHLSEFEIGCEGIHGTSLFEWYPDQDRKVSKLMIHLKGGELSETFRFYARNFVGRLSKRLPSQSVFVPCPSSQARLHSQTLAGAFSEILGFPVIDSLQSDAQESQKVKSREARERLQLRNCHDFRQHNVIFIDDVVTTGATARSARNAIGSCQSFQVWCLAHRSSLAGVPRL